jgi:hypothetical protein
MMYCNSNGCWYPSDCLSEPLCNATQGQKDEYLIHGQSVAPDRLAVGLYVNVKYSCERQYGVDMVYPELIPLSTFFGRFSLSS